MEFHCAATFGNVPSVDILVSSLDGSAQVALQVKTTMWGLRYRGRGNERRPYEYQWDIGWKCARLNQPNLFFALVDLKGFKELPEVFIVPSGIIATYFEAGPEGWPRPRYHETVENLSNYRENWKAISDMIHPAPVPE